MARDYNSAEFQKFLDEQQYSRNGILRYEKIFGEDFVSTGGITTTKVSSMLHKLYRKIGGKSLFLIVVLKLTAHFTFVRPNSLVSVYF